MRAKSINFTDKSAAAFKKELETALLSFDIDKFRHFYNKWTLLGIYDEPLPKSDLLLMVSMCKMICNIQSAPKADKERAKKWLEDRGYNTSMV